MKIILIYFDNVDFDAPLNTETFENKNKLLDRINELHAKNYLGEIIFCAEIREEFNFEPEETVVKYKFK